MKNGYTEQKTYNIVIPFGWTEGVKAENGSGRMA